MTTLTILYFIGSWALQIVITKIAWVIGYKSGYLKGYNNGVPDGAILFHDMTLLQKKSQQKNDNIDDKE